jgi:hypothetical protein
MGPLHRRDDRIEEFEVPVAEVAGFSLPTGPCPAGSSLVEVFTPCG